MFRSPFVPLVLAVCFLFAPLPALDAAPQGPGGPGSTTKHVQRPVARLLPPPGYLGLDEAQREAAGALLEVLVETTRPLAEALRANRRAIGDLLGAAQPDATAIGDLVIDGAALRAEKRDALTAFDESFSALLDADQLSRWQHYKELKRLSRRPRGDSGGDDTAEGTFGLGR